MSQGDQENEKILKAELPTLIDAISNQGTQLMSAKVLAVVLENLAELASRGTEFTASVEGSICKSAIAVYLQYRNDGRIIELCQTIISKLTQNPASSGLLQARLVPILTDRMVADPKKVSADVLRDLETLRILVEKSPQPLSSILIDAFPVLCRSILGSEENTDRFLSSASIVLDSYLSVGARRVIGYKDNDGKNGLQYILQVVDHLYGAAIENDRNTMVGFLILAKLTTPGTILGQNMEQLLKAMLGYSHRPMRVVNNFRTSAHAEPAVWTLWLVWAQLFRTEFDAVIQYLSIAQGPDGQSALAIVISDVFCNALDSLSFGDGCRKVFRTALVKMVDYGFSHLDSTLHKIEFHETKEGTKRTVPILVKISELVTSDLQAIHQAVRP